MIYRFFGVGKRADDKIIFTIVEDITRSELIPRYETVQKLKCSKQFIWRYCYTITQQISKGYTSNELDEIKKGLEIVSSIGIKKIVFGLKKEFVIELTNNNEMYSLSGEKALRIENGLGIIFSVKDREKIKKGIQAYTVFGQFSDPERGPYSLVVKEDGNIIIVDYENGVVWESNTRDKGKAPYNTILTEDGIFILVDSKNKPIYDSQNRYKPFNYILVQEYRIYSENSNYYALIQSDGGVCVYSNGRDGKDSKIKEFYPDLVLQKKAIPPYTIIANIDGMKIVDGNGKFIYNTGHKYGFAPPFTFELTNNGLLRLVDAYGKTRWDIDNLDSKK